MALRDRARRRVASAARRVGRAFGQDIVARNFYSPVPRWELLAGDVFERRSPLGGIDLDLDAGIGFLSSLAPFLREFEPPTGFDLGQRHV
jgi:hypothetical protein